MTPATNRYRRLWGYLRPYWKIELLALLVMAVIAALTLAIPRAMQYMIDDLIPSLASASRSGVSINQVIWFGVLLVGIYVANVLLCWVRDYLAGVVGAGIIRDIRLDMYRHLQRLSLKFHHEHQVGEIMSRLLNDVFRVQSLLGETLLTFLMNFLLLIAILTYLLSTNWILSLVAIIPVPLTVLASDRYGKKVHSLISTLQDKVAAVSGNIQERLMGIKTVKAFGQEEREARGLNVLLEDVFHLSVQNSVTMSLASNLIQLINMIGPIIILVWGVYLVAIGSMKLGELIAFYILLTYLYAPVQSLAQSNIQFQSAMASVDRINEYLNIPTKIAEPDSPIRPKASTGHIEFRDVSFTYGNPAFSIQNFSLEISARRKIALVGPSGSGKTTIVSLLMRFYDPTRGQVLIDDVDLRSVPISYLREHIAFVDQDPLLFRGTVRENIAYGRPTATFEEICAAARTANIDDFIMSLPNGYNTEVGERGVTISGGERQRLCLARAMLVDPTILILDEATSALDSNSEQLIQESLTRILAEKTAIIVAHRLSTVQHADEIVVINAGRIVDRGSHLELLNRCILYQDLVRKQWPAHLLEGETLSESHQV